MNIVPAKMVWQWAAQLPDIYNMDSRFAGLWLVSITFFVIYRCGLPCRCAA
ncbi:hypothetical protein GSC54_004656 [Salmonella enterica]|nr:hypothetical protein [Salmonella enterica]